MPYTRHLEADFARARHEHPDWPSVISEGDSWFSFPFERNAVDWLDDPKDTADPKRQTPWALLRLEHSGDELLTILSGSQKAKLRQVVRRYRPDLLLFSGGGNDIAGPDLLPLLNQYAAGMTATECLNDERVARRMSQLLACYLDLVDIIRDESPATKVVGHTYDYIVPSDKGVSLIGPFTIAGPWLKPSLVAKGIVDPALQRGVVTLLIDRFVREVLDRVDQGRGVYSYANARGLVGTDWVNEIHPNRRGSKRVADALARQFEIVIPALRSLKLAAAL